jgi:serine protease Do
MDDSPLSRRQFLAAGGLATASAIAGCALEPGSSDDNEQPGNFPQEYQEPPVEDQQPPAETELTEVYREVIDSVAAIRMEGGGGAGGTGWVYDENYLVTNEHVVAAGDVPFVRFKDVGWREASVVGTDRFSDLAVLEVPDKPDQATPLSLVGREPPVGTRVAAVGNPFDLSGSFTTGVISGRDRNIETPGSNFSIADGIQTDTALNPGNSGGPLITIDGDVVGVVVAGQGDNVGFAISAAMVNNVVPALISEGEYQHSYLGVFLRDVSPRLIEANDLPVTWGVYMTDVLDSGPAAGALQGADSEAFVRGQSVPVGGDVIVRMDDWTIQNRERLSAFLALETEPGDTIEIEVVRNGERETVDVTLGARSNAQTL